MKFLALTLTSALSLIAAPQTFNMDQQADTAIVSQVQEEDTTSPLDMPAEGERDVDLSSIGTADQEGLGLYGAEWASLVDNDRYLFIMGTIDGFSAAGDDAKAPCFPGKTNLEIDASLAEDGFGDKDAAMLPDALKGISDGAQDCSTAKKRGYSAELIKTMSDENIATYLTAVVKGYASVADCPMQNHSYAAASVAAAVFAANDAAQPTEVIKPAIISGCAGPE